MIRSMYSGSIISVSADGKPIEPNLEARVGETPPYKTYVTWNFWGYGYTRADYGLVRGSAFDYSWTSEAVNKALEVARQEASIQ